MLQVKHDYLLNSVHRFFQSGAEIEILDWVVLGAFAGHGRLKEYVEHRMSV
jgi:hypothetical protein